MKAAWWGVLLLAGCGGGGGGGAVATGATTLAGTAAVGAPVVGGAVQVMDATGRVVGTATTSSTGGYSVTLAAGATAPFMLQLTGGHYIDATVSPAVTKNLAAPLHSVAIASGIANITGLTEMIVAHTLAESPATAFTSCKTTPVHCTALLTPTKLQLAHDGLLRNVQGLIDQVVAQLGAGAATVTHFLTQSFAANSATSMDVLLDSMKPAVNVVAGEAQMTLTVSGVDYVFAMNTAGAAMPATGAPVASNVVNAGVVSIPHFASAVAATRATVQANQSGGASALAQMRAEYVAAHNKWRAGVGVPALTYSVAQEAIAQAWVNQLQAQGCGLVHSNTQGQYGENLFAAWGATYSPTQIVDTWAGEGVSYNYASNTCAAGKVCGHYTQVVWRNTTAIGCAVATCPATQKQVVACQYTPPGNYTGQRPY